MANVKQRHLGGLNIAFLAAGKMDQSILPAAREALEGSGAMIKVIAARKTAGGHVDLLFAEARADDFDGVLVAGGTEAFQTLKSDKDAARLLRGMEKEGKPVAGLEDGDNEGIHTFMKALAERTHASVRGTADDLPGAAAMGG